MKIQLNTDHHIQADESVVRHAEDTIGTTLARYAGQVTRVEVHLRDANAGKGGTQDKHCTLEARLGHRPPATASEDAGTVAAAIAGAAKKLARVLDSSIGKLG